MILPFLWFLAWVALACVAPLLVGAYSVRLASDWCGEKIGWGRAALTALLAVALPATYLRLLGFPGSSSASVIDWLVSSSIGVVSLYLVVKLMLPHSWWRSVRVSALVVAFGAFGLLLLVLVRESIVDFATLESGSMSPTIVDCLWKGECPSCQTTQLTGAPLLGNQPDPSVPAVCVACGAEYRVPQDRVYRDHFVWSRLAAPRRWSLAVFRSWDDPEMLYAKRVVGVPGESIEIRRGEIFIDGNRLAKPVDGLETLWIPVAMGIPPNGEDRPSTVFWWTGDNPGRWDGRSSPWRFDCTDADVERLQLCRSLTDASPFVVRAGQQSYAADGPGRGANPVADVRVRVRVRELRGDGYLSLVWAVEATTVALTVRPSGEIRLLVGDRETEGRFVRDGGDGFEIALAIRDGTAAAIQFRNGTTDVLAMEKIGLEDYATHAGTLALSAVVRGVRGQIDGLAVDRDVYYTDVSGTTFGASGAPCRLGAGEYFVLGDYAASSLDSRMRGPVPEDRIEGRVLSIYWPPTRWTTFE